MTLWAENYAAIMHELETPWREHDKCCDQPNDLTPTPA